MADALGIGLSEALLAEFTAAASFDAMKRNADQFAPESGRGFWKRETDFFARGTNAQWKDALSAQQITAFDVRLAQLLPDAAARNWLLNGSAPA
jgi:aryl sulfotransferase